MSARPEQAIKQVTAELYERFGCAGAPRAKTAKLLEQIDLATDELTGQRDRWKHAALTSSHSQTREHEDAWGALIDHGDYDPE
ncbi:MAG TPA: hypothetical protein VFG60_09865 [Burkholderiaceae bacterium]|nr:hypothetical protein [Burkholderiaceae bacterium]